MEIPNTEITVKIQLPQQQVTRLQDHDLHEILEESCIKTIASLLAKQ